MGEGVESPLGEGMAVAPSQGQPCSKCKVVGEGEAPGLIFRVLKLLWEAPPPTHTTLILRETMNTGQSHLPLHFIVFICRRS